MREPIDGASWLNFVDADPGPELPGTRYTVQLAPEAVSKPRHVFYGAMTEQRVLDARRRHAEGVSYLQLAREFGVSRSAVVDAVVRRTWRHVP